MEMLKYLDKPKNNAEPSRAPRENVLGRYPKHINPYFRITYS